MAHTPATGIIPGSGSGPTTPGQCIYTDDTSNPSVVVIDIDTGYEVRGVVTGMCYGKWPGHVAGQLTAAQNQCNALGSAGRN